MSNKNKGLSAKCQEPKLTGILYLESKPICLVDDSTSEEIVNSFKNVISYEVKNHNNKCSFRLFIG